MAFDFDPVAPTYDRLNRIMTAGLDRRWRRRAVQALGTQASSLRPHPAFHVLDVACGTGDLSLDLLRRGHRVTGVDFSEQMLALARRKAAAARFQLADAEALPFPDATFDAVTCAFGIRNFVHLEQGLREMLRVLKPGGRLLLLEMATPDSPLVRPLYHLYARRIIPLLGHLLARNRQAYTYLPASIERFPKGQAFLDILQNTKYKIQNCREQRFTFGVCRLYAATKE